MFRVCIRGTAMKKYCLRISENGQQDQEFRVFFFAIFLLIFSFESALGADFRSSVENVSGLIGEKHSGDGCPKGYGATEFQGEDF
ncbi:MAG: hypothetical protein ACE5FU_09935 [Nitrospinota bacterium]